MENITPEFIHWPKMARLSREIICTEKIDGSSAQVYIDDAGQMFFGSRNRWLTKEADNFGFFSWGERNREELLKLGPGPLQILAEVSEKNWQFWERSYIHMYRALGFNLTNCTAGGDGLANPTKETRVKIGLKHRGKKLSLRQREAIRIRQTGRKLSEETRRKMSAAQKGRRHSPATLEKMCKAQAGENHPMFGKKHTPEYCKKMSLAVSGEKNGFFGKKHSAETRATLSNLKKGLPWTPARRAAQERPT